MREAVKDDQHLKKAFNFKDVDQAYKLSKTDSV